MSPQRHRVSLRPSAGERAPKSSQLDLRAGRLAVFGGASQWIAAVVCIGRVCLLIVTTLWISELAAAAEQDEFLPSPSDMTIVDHEEIARPTLPMVLDTDSVVSLGQATELPVPVKVASRSWLDIRPQSLDEAHPSTISSADLPDDVSAMPAKAEIPQMVQLYATDLRPVDFCAATTFCHLPLYFEDRSLERHGVSRGVLGRLPAVRSGVHFLASSALLPIKVLHDPPHRCVRSGCTCR